MGAVAPVPHWKAEDDLLLKNAVEAGASLESLAKGAVLFSRRFTVQELQDRWHSLLYDPVISAEASARMIEFERFSLTLQSNSCKFDSTKETKDLSGKRKADSIHRCYSAMRKRVLSETINSMDMNFLAGPGVTNYGNRHEPPPSCAHPHGQISADCMYGDPVCDNFGIQDSNFEVLNQAFPDLGDGGVSATVNDVVNNAPAFCTSRNLSLAQNSVDQNICPPLEENISCTRAHYKVEEFGQPVSDLFEAEDLRAKHPSIFGQVVDNGGIPISDCGTSSHNIRYPSSLTQALGWSTTEGISAPTLPEIDFGGKQDYTNNSFTLPDDGGNPNTSGYGILHSNFNLNHQITNNDVKALSPKAAKIIAELSDRLMDFSDQDDLFDAVDESYLDDLGSLLLDSPNESDMPIVCTSEPSVATDEYLKFSSGELPGKLGDKGLYQCSDRRMGRSSEEKLLSSALPVNPDFPELRNGVICCTLNTEDPDIPSNDDVFLPVRLPSSSSLPSLADWKSSEAHYPVITSVRDIPTHQKASHGGPLMMTREQSNYEQGHFSPKILGSSLPQEIGPNRAFCGHSVKLELPHNDAQNGTLRGATSQSPSQRKSTNGNTNNFLGVPIKEKIINSEHAESHNHHRVGSYLENQVISHDCILGFRTSASSSKLEANALAMVHNEFALNAKLGSTGLTVPKADVSSALSDKEECPSESDDDVPYFSDVEAMILDMDLSPIDQDLYSSKKVLKYQHEESKRTIIRLEQAADAYMQRAMEASGAFAVLYGRHSKHFIKKPEVLVGRATEDIKVDIDLGREARANKISRRQAIIKLGTAGSFCLKNYGKCSIHVNGKEVAPSHTHILTSGCLIEVRGIAFIFETNRTRIKQHMDTVTKGSQTSEQKPIIR